MTPSEATQLMNTKLDTFTTAYIKAALWSSTCDDGEPLDENYSFSDLAPETLEKMIADCADFQSSFGEYIAPDLERAGHDFWLTRNGHGAGFWDGDWNEPFPVISGSVDSALTAMAYPTVGKYLTAMSHACGSADLYVGDDGKIYQS